MRALKFVIGHISLLQTKKTKQLITKFKPVEESKQQTQRVYCSKGIKYALCLVYQDGLKPVSSNYESVHFAL